MEEALEVQGIGGKEHMIKDLDYIIERYISLNGKSNCSRYIICLQSG